MRVSGSKTVAARLEESNKSIASPSVTVIKSRLPSSHVREEELQGVLYAARLMLVAARTAPKAKGMDSIETAIIKGEDLGRLAAEMRALANKLGRAFYSRDAGNVEASDCVVLIGARAHEPLGLNCGLCVYEDCSKRLKSWEERGRPMRGPFCEFKVLDLGIAVGSAVKMASLLNVDNRVMYSVGHAALNLQLLPKATLALGIPLSARGKSIYFDRRT